MGAIKRSGAGRWIMGAFVLLLFGLVASYLMFFGAIRSTLFLNMLAVFCSLVGLVVGMYGTFLIIQANRKRDKDDRIDSMMHRK